MQFETVIGFEIHAELLTESKIFCGCSTRFGQPPNTQVCPVCLGLPGSLPVLNERAVDLALRTAIALDCDITRRTQFERKNYYYPDLPKNYQISQLRKNLAVGGRLDVPVGGEIKRIRIDNIHLEEDAGKNIHPEHPGANYSLVDLNRAGTSLLEVVTQPDLRSVDEARAFMETLKSLLEYIEVSDCNMHEGRLRFEANISVRPRGDDKLGTKVEIKNLNSMKSVLRCIEIETERQVELIEDGGRVVQETRLWDEAAGVTRTMRTKEVANDYRYFPDPDLVEVEIDDAWIARVRAELPELPQARRRRFIEAFELSEYDAGVLTAQKAVADYFEAALADPFEGPLPKVPPTKGLHSPRAGLASGKIHNPLGKASPKGIANWIMTETLRWLGEDPDRTIADYPIPPADLARLVVLIEKGEISNAIAKKVYFAMREGGGSPEAIVKALGLVQISDAAEIEPLVDEVLARNAETVASYRAGKERALGVLVGQVMKATRGKANPQLVNELILRKIKN